jgi:hypothetical protein
MEVLGQKSGEFFRVLTDVFEEALNRRPKLREFGIILVGLVRPFGQKGVFAGRSVA